MDTLRSRRKPLGACTATILFLLFFVLVSLWLSSSRPTHTLTRPIVPQPLADDTPTPDDSPSETSSQPDHSPDHSPAYQAASSPPLPPPSSSPRILPDQRVLYNSPATYPRLTRLSDGSILLSFTRTVIKPNPNADADVDSKQQQPPLSTRILTVHRSIDNGTTFHPWSVIWHHDSNDIGNLFLLEVPLPVPADSPTPPNPLEAAPPRVLAAFRNHDVAKADLRHRTFFRITLCESLDGGRTWRYVTQVAEKTAPWGLWEPFMRIGSGGSLPGHVQMTYSRELAARDQDTILHESFDGGRTWSAGRTVTGDGSEGEGGETMLRDGMTGIAATVDVGSGGVQGEDAEAKPALVMVFETTRYGRTFSVEAVISYDDGATWGHRQPVYEPLPVGDKNGDGGGGGGGMKRGNAGSPQIESFAHGGLAVIFMTDEDLPAAERRWPYKATVKTLFGGPLVNGQIQWLEQPPLETCARQSMWPGIFRLSEYQLMVACEHGEGILGRLLEWAPP